MTRTDTDPEIDGLVGGVSRISTKDLPGGTPEDEMKNAKNHKLGHLQSTKDTIDS